MMTNSARVVRFHEFGGANVLKIAAEPLPQPKEGEVRILVRAMGINRADVLFRKGLYLWKPQLPARIGVEASGIVDAVGPGCSEDWVGKRVITLPNYSPAEYGVYGEVAIIPEGSIIEFPESINFVDAAAIIAQYMTAWGGLVHFGKVRKGHYVLMTAASSSTGIAAIQVVKAQGGVSIAVTRSPDKAQALLKCGADHVVVGGREDLAARVMEITGGAGARVVYDPIAGESLKEVVATAAKGALILEYGVLSDQPTVIPMMEAFLKYLTIKIYDVHEILENAKLLASGIQYIFERLGSGVLKPVISKTFPLDRIVEAHEYMEAGSQIGKIIVTTD